MNMFNTMSVNTSAMNSMEQKLYTITESYGPHVEGWEEYKEWIRLPQLTEIVSIDPILCPSIIPFNSDSNAFWQSAFPEKSVLNYFHRDRNYVNQNAMPETPGTCNVLMLILNPRHKDKVKIGDYYFCGYDLLNSTYDASALTNCGGFYDIYSPDELNSYGLFSAHDRAIQVQKALALKYPNSHDAETNVFALYRKHNKSVHTDAITAAGNL